MHSSSNNQRLLIQWQACALKLQLIYKLQMKRWFTQTLCCPYSHVLVCNVLSSSPQQFNLTYSTATLNYASSFKTNTSSNIHTAAADTQRISQKQQTDTTSNKSRKFTWCGVYIFFLICTISLLIYSFGSDTRLMTSTEYALQRHTDGVAHLTLWPRTTLILQ
jgi:hypothetical protein